MARFSSTVALTTLVFAAIGPVSHVRGAEPSQLVSTSSRPRPSGLNTVSFPINNQWQTGLHLLDSSDESLVMGRDGWLHTISHDAGASPLRLVDEPFQVASATEMRNQLRAEFGRNFDVIATKNFLVVQPRGRGDRWPDMFEKSHRAFVDGMSRRGVAVRQGRFPMVAIVMPDARAMYAEFERLGLDVSRVAGLYSNRCNRVITHDGGQFDMIAVTVRHEAAHQSAFNTGVHSRVNDTPSWITEGIGQMFEPEAIGGGVSGSRLSDRVNQESVEHLRSHLNVRDAAAIGGLVEQLIQGDEMFKNQATIHTAYAMSWAMMFYLAERDSSSFAEILNFTATRPPFETYRPGQRQIDFQRIVEQDIATFSSRLTTFLTSLP